LFNEVYDLHGIDELDVIGLHGFFQQKVEDEENHKREWIDEYDSFEENYNYMIESHDKRIKHLKEIVEQLKSYSDKI
jgi:hypothetical protein